MCRHNILFSFINDDSVSLIKENKINRKGMNCLPAHYINEWDVWFDFDYLNAM